MCAININNIEADGLGPQRGVAVLAPQVGEVGLGHRPCLHRIVAESHGGQVAGAERHFAGVEVRPVHAVVGEFDARKSPAWSAPSGSTPKATLSSPTPYAVPRCSSLTAFAL